MKIPPFTEFQFNEDRFISMWDEEKITIHLNPTAEEVIALVSKMSKRFTLSVLADYHEWLSDILNDAK
ncbi:MAG: hypothetical protein FWB71_00800 [Defluviitaleaceae bacterium]|nr:hypothetical protein [Defluviitaleaceae bacterium]